MPKKWNCQSWSQNIVHLIEFRGQTRATITLAGVTGFLYMHNALCQQCCLLMHRECTFKFQYLQTIINNAAWLLAISNGWANPLRDVSPYYAISAAYNSPIMHYGRLVQRRALKDVILPPALGPLWTSPCDFRIMASSNSSLTTKIWYMKSFSLLCYKQALLCSCINKKIVWTLFD